MTPANDNHIGEPLRFLSVCSGIEAASVAWTQLGWQCIGVAEIEPFPAFVLAHHYGASRPQFMPDAMEPGIKPKDMKARKTALKAMSRLPVDSPLPNYGDFTKIEPAKLGRVDILCGGTPCQAFSVAGLRQSLDDARGNLSLEFVRLAHELADGNGLRNVVWENVVGVLSTKDNAFGCFLGGLVGATAAIEPVSRGKWPRFGMVSGPKGRAAWAVKDAQFFGVAQRRRRVLVVADFGNGADPAEVLFELLGVSGDTPPSREAGKDIAPTIGSGAQSSSGYTPEIARCVATREGTSQDYETTTMVAIPISTMDHISRGENHWRPFEVGAPSYTLTKAHSHAVCITGDVAHSLRAEGADASEDGTGRGTPIIAFDCKASGQSGFGIGDIAGTQRAMGHANSHTNGGGHQAAMVGSIVRRLTCRECERLQGFQFLVTPAYPGAWQDDSGRWWSPDYTAIPWRGKPTSPDGPRYKALGNSWAVPKFTWLGRRIAMHMPANDNEMRQAA